MQRTDDYLAAYDTFSKWTFLMRAAILTFFIEYLDELKDKGNRSETAKYIGDIYLKMLEKVTPDFDQKHIRSIVEFLYEVEERENASNICNIYGREGYEFLRDIYERYSNQ